MSTSLVQSLIEVNSRLQRIPDRLGVPDYQNVILVYQNAYTELLPRPQVHSVSPRRARDYLAAGVEIFLDDREITGIPASYPENLLMDARYLLDAVKQPDGSWVGKKAEALLVARDGYLQWKVLVRRMRQR